MQTERYIETLTAKGHWSVSTKLIIEDQDNIPITILPFIIIIVIVNSKCLHSPQKQSHRN